MCKVFIKWTGVQDCAEMSGTKHPSSFCHVSPHPWPWFCTIIIPAGFKKISRVKWLRNKTNTAHNGVVDQPQGLLGSVEGRLWETVFSENINYFQAFPRRNLPGFGDIWQRTDWSVCYQKWQHLLSLSEKYCPHSSGGAISSVKRPAGNRLPNSIHTAWAGTDGGELNATLGSRASLIPATTTGWVQQVGGARFTSWLCTWMLNI